MSVAPAAVPIPSSIRSVSFGGGTTIRSEHIRQLGLDRLPQVQPLEELLRTMRLVCGGVSF
jgi:hypothetical protein